MGRPSAPAADTGARDTLAIAPALSPETSRASKLAFAVGGLLGIGLIVLWLTGVIEFAGRVALAALVVAVALTLISAPLWRATVNRLGAERVARARADERADVAAHLHDSVLQTLALIPTRSKEADQVARLARRQERELREWLSDTEPSRPDERLADALRAAAADVEDSHGGPDRGGGRRRCRAQRAARGTRGGEPGGADQLRSSSPRRAARCASMPRSRRAGRVCSSTTAGSLDPESIPADRRGVPSGSRAYGEITAGPRRSAATRATARRSS